MQHSKQATNGSAATEDSVLYVIDHDSGWEHDEHIVWHIDEGNEAARAESIPEIIEG
jgi:hypothetical protein